MISYKLAKQLKDAGFEQECYSHNRFYSVGQKGKKGLFLAGDRFKWKHAFDQILSKGYYKIPTLSELIKACGDEFRVLENDALKTKESWMAASINKDDGTIDICEFGSSPEEVVANLWLKLNK